MNRQHLTIGNQIIEGPRAIFPLDSGNDWLEKDLSIYVNSFVDNRIQHISLWSDSTMNKNDNFIKPLIRFAHWEKHNDNEKFKNNIDIEWPDIRIILGYVNQAKFERLNSGILEIQELIPKVSFSALGISLNREIATLERSDLSVDYEIWIRNGVQSLRYYSPFLDNDIFSKKVLDLKNLLLASMDEIDYSGWKERYDAPLRTSYFDWDYKKINGR